MENSDGWAGRIEDDPAYPPPRLVDGIYPDYTCTHCGKQGVSEKAMDVFVASLCEDCFWVEFRGYLKAVSGHEWTEEQARAVYGAEF